MLSMPSAIAKEVSTARSTVRIADRIHHVKRELDIGLYRAKDITQLSPIQPEAKLLSGLINHVACNPKYRMRTELQTKIAESLLGLVSSSLTVGARKISAAFPHNNKSSIGRRSTEILRRQVDDVELLFRAFHCRTCLRHKISTRIVAAT